MECSEGLKRFQRKNLFLQERDKICEHIKWLSLLKKNLTHIRKEGGGENGIGVSFLGSCAVDSSFLMPDLA